jgi:predicted acyltransferase
MNPATPPAVPVPNSEAGERLVSLDALRGFDMIWILGADAVVKALAQMTGLRPLRGLAAQMEHKVWDGFAFYDLIFPLFLFISGVAMVYSLPKAMARNGRAAALRRILVRAVILFGLGVLYNGGLAEAWPDVRIAGVLQRIALAYAATGILFCLCRTRTLYITGAVVLLGYWALLALVPVRDITLTKEAMVAALGETQPSAAAVRQLYDSTSTWVTGHFERGLNLANHVDYQWLPGAKYRTYWDPEGLLSTLPAIATCLLGVMAGHQLRRPDRTPGQKLRWLAAAGGLCLATGWLWHGVFPVVKDLWSSSFVLVAGGWSLWLLAGFYYVVDIRLWRGWCQPFVWIGLNPITLYLATSLVDFWGIARRLVGGSVAARLDSLAPGTGELGLAVVSLALLLALARFLHQRRIYLRV